MTGDELKKYRFPETLTNQSRWFGLYLDELIPAGYQKTEKRAGQFLVTRSYLLVSADFPS